MNKNIKKIVKHLIIIPGYFLLRTFLPIKKDLILFESNLGRNFSGNPKYIYLEMVRQGIDKEIECVWVLEDVSIPIPGEPVIIRRSRLMYYFYLARAKIWIFDTRDPPYVVKRKGAYYIQTWHGTPLKRLGMDMEKVNMGDEVDIDLYRENFYKDSRKWDFLLSQNDFSTEIFQSAFSFGGKKSPNQEIWTYGYPRNDVLVKHKQKEFIKKLKNDLNIPLNKKVLLYAPTWRDNQFYRKSVYKFTTNIDFKLLQDSLSDEYVLLIKYHYLVMDNIDWSNYDGFIYLFPAEMDINDLYLVSDMLITDYSSVMFDYSILDRPMLFFMYDLEEYRDQLRGFYFEVLEELPGPISRTTQELIKDIKTYDNQTYKEKYLAFKEKFVKYDDGKASQRVINRILELIN